MRRGMWGIGTVVTAFLLVACGSLPSPVPSTSSMAPTPTSTPIDGASPTPLPTAGAGTNSFSGDCTNAFSDAQLTAIFCVTMTDFGVNWSIGQEEALGGLKCTWWADDEKLSAIVVLTSLPAAVAPESVITGVECSGAGRCTATMVTSQGWYSMSVSGSTIGNDEGVTQALLETAAHRGDALPSPVIPATTAATWQRPTPECADLGSLITPPNGAPLTLDGEMSRQDPLLKPLDEVLGNTCFFSMPHPDPDALSNTITLGVSVLPGGAIAFDAGLISGKGVPLDIVNGRAAVVLMPIIYEGSSGVFATDGTNTVMVEVPPLEEASDFGWVAEQLIDGLAP